jgi:hypothetical protein
MLLSNVIAYTHIQSTNKFLTVVTKMKTTILNQIGREQSQELQKTSLCKLNIHDAEKIYSAYQ